jgi:hypothetical protein
MHPPLGDLTKRLRAHHGRVCGTSPRHQWWWLNDNIFALGPRGQGRFLLLRVQVEPTTVAVTVAARVLLGPRGRKAIFLLLHPLLLRFTSVHPCLSSRCRSRLATWDLGVGGPSHRRSSPSPATITIIDECQPPRSKSTRNQTVKGREEEEGNLYGKILRSTLKLL